MKAEYNFSGGRRGAVGQPASGKVRATLCLDSAVLDWFRSRADASGGGDYSVLINDALRQHIIDNEEPLEQLLRRVLREELSSAA